MAHLVAQVTADNKARARIAFPLALEGGAAELGAEGLAKGEGGFDFAVGVGEHIEEFAQATGSSTYGELAGDWTFVPENFESIANAARNIRINTQGMSWARYHAWLEANPEAWNLGVTNWEIHQIVNNPLWLAKSILVLKYHRCR